MRQSTHELFRLTDKQFDHIYRQALEPQLQEIESHRKQALFFKFGVWLAGAVVLLGAFIAATRSATPAPLFIVAIIFVPLIIAAGQYFVKQYQRTYKETLIPQVLKHIGADLRYAARPAYSTQVLDDSNLFNERIDKVKAEDGISGTVGDTKLSIAEIVATRGSGKSEHTVFDGIFCKATYDEKFRGWLWVYPESKIVGDGTLWGNVLASFGIEKFESSRRVRVNDSRFESRFRVYGSSPKHVETILTPKLMNNLIALHDKSEKVALTLKGRTVYVAMWTNDDYLEPTTWLPATDRKTITRVLSELGVMLSIVEDLNVQYY